MLRIDQASGTTTVIEGMHRGRVFFNVSVLVGLLLLYFFCVFGTAAVIISDKDPNKGTAFLFWLICNGAFTALLVGSRSLLWELLHTGRTMLIDAASRTVTCTWIGLIGRKTQVIPFAEIAGVEILGVTSMGEGTWMAAQAELHLKSGQILPIQVWAPASDRPGKMEKQAEETRVIAETVAAALKAAGCDVGAPSFRTYVEDNG